MILFGLFFALTRHGKMMQAVSEDRDAAGPPLVGINVRLVFLWIWALGSLLGGLAGVLMAPIILVYPDMGLSILVKSFAAAVLGGFDSLAGAVVGGLLMGIFEQMLSGYAGTMFQDIAGFSVIILVLLIPSERGSSAPRNRPASSGARPGPRVAATESTGSHGPSPARLSPLRRGGRDRGARESPPGW